MSDIYPLKSRTVADECATPASRGAADTPGAQDKSNVAGKSPQRVVELYTFRGFCPKG